MSIRNSDQKSIGERMASVVVACLCFLLFHLATFTSPLFAIFGLVSLGIAMTGRRGNIRFERVSATEECPKCEQQQEGRGGGKVEYYIDIDKSEVHSGLLSSSTVTRETRMVKCLTLGCDYKSKANSHQIERRNRLRRQAAAAAHVDIEMVEQMEQEEAKEMFRQNKRDTRGTSLEDHPESARLQASSAGTCPSCGVRGKMSFARNGRIHHRIMSTPIVLAAKSYAECRNCDYIAPLASHKRACQEQQQEQQQQMAEVVVEQETSEMESLLV